MSSGSTIFARPRFDTYSPRPFSELLRSASSEYEANRILLDTDYVKFVSNAFFKGVIKAGSKKH